MARFAMLVAAAVLLATTVAVSAQTLKVMPGATTMSRGFDMIAGVQQSDLTRKILLPVFEFTYNDGTTWTDPTNSSRVYSVPDQLVPTNLDASEQSIDLSIHTTYNQWITQEESSFNVGAGVTIGEGTKAFTGNFNFSRESYHYHELMKTTDVASGNSGTFYSLFSLESLPPAFMQKAPVWQEVTGQLPPSIKTGADQTKYNQVIQYFGTHFVSWANFGGNARVNTFVNKTVMSKHSQSWVENQFGLTLHYYLFQLSGGGFFNHSSIHRSSAFVEASKTFTYFRGGNVLLQSNMTARDWVDSIPLNPVYLNCTIQDLSILVSNTAVATQLRKVIQTYIDTGKLPPVSDDYDYEAFYDNMELRLAAGAKTTISAPALRGASA